MSDTGDRKIRFSDVHETSGGLKYVVVETTTPADSERVHDMFALSSSDYIAKYGEGSEITFPSI